MGDIVDLKVPGGLDRSSPRTLDQIAESVNETVREVREFQDDKRLQMALDLAEAKALCATQDIPFKQWVADNIELVGYPEATTLAKIGEAADPAVALEDHRAKKRTSKAQADAKKKVGYVANSDPAPVPAPPTRGKDAICERVSQAIQTLSGLPPAEQVAGYFNDSDQAILVDERVLRALDWLTEFAERRSNPDAG